MDSLLLSSDFLQAAEMVNPYVAAAVDQAAILSGKIGRDFISSVSSIDELTPIFFAAACSSAIMDKITKMAKSGQLPWHPGGIGNGAYNKIIANVRKYGRIFRQKQSQSYKLEVS